MYALMSQLVYIYMLLTFIFMQSCLKLVVICIYWTIFFITECSENTFGIDCKQICGNCRNGEQCHQVNGSCPNGCNEGATGANCDIGIWV